MLTKSGLLIINNHPFLLFLFGLFGVRAGVVVAEGVVAAFTGVLGVEDTVELVLAGVSSLLFTGVLGIAPREAVLLAVSVY